MFKLIISGFGLLLTTLGLMQPDPRAHLQNAVYCHPDISAVGPNAGMEIFAGDPAFQALHPSPLAIRYQAQGETVSFASPDGTNASGYLVKARKKSDKWLFVYQEWWGLNDHIRKMADVFYNDLDGTVNVLAIDMYDGKSTSDPKEAGQLMQGRDQKRLENIVKAAYQYAGTKARVANVGWCFGGNWSLRSALIGGRQNIGSVIYYGMPVRDVEQLKTLNSDVLGLFATEQYISKEIIEDFAAKMKEAGKKLDYRIFDAVHGFSNPSNPRYDEAKSREAYGMALRYLKQKFS